MYIYIYTYVDTNIYYLCDGFLLALTLREHITREGVLREHITFVTASSLPLPLGNTLLEKVFLGNTLLEKVFLGNTLPL